MFRSHGPFRAMCTAAALVLVLCSPAGAQDAGAGDDKEISSYKLTDAGLARFEQAHHSLQALPATRAADCDSEASEDSEGVNTIDQVVARLNATAGAPAAVKAAGITPREYVVFGMALFQAGMATWALAQPGAKLPTGVSMDNVNFYRRHQAELQKLDVGKKSSNCDDG